MPTCEIEFSCLKLIKNKFNVRLNNNVVNAVNIKNMTFVPIFCCGQKVRHIIIFSREFLMIVITLKT